ncbi:hypothetical protein GE061_007208 [Apolygus lucorum]|uniref:Uncharacterized protein n=1 Tax=Apolygus lucorum TaxID=248454 RepID=A0A8S9WRB5_APOLU|nr:hypothetical protein GE061_007208 [Apolygus lucorum]
MYTDKECADCFLFAQRLLFVRDTYSVVVACTIEFFENCDFSNLAQSFIAQTDPKPPEQGVRAMEVPNSESPITWWVIGKLCYHHR